MNLIYTIFTESHRARAFYERITKRDILSQPCPLFLLFTRLVNFALIYLIGRKLCEGRTSRRYVLR